MLFKQIKYFLSIVDTGSFTEAAAQCFISQSAVSQQINALEAELGVQLFERSPRRVILTGAGHYLYEHGRQLVQEAARLKQGVQAAAGIRDRRFTVACESGCLPGELYRALGNFKKAHPDVDVDVYNAGSEECFVDLENGSADLALTARAFPEYSFQAFFLPDRPCFAAFAGIYSLGSNNAAETADLANLPCIIVSTDKERDSQQKFYRENFFLKNYFLFASTTEEAELMAAAGNGFLITDSDKPVAGLKKVPLYANGVRLQRSYFLHTNNSANAYVREFVELMTELCRARENAPDSKVVE